MTFDGLAKSIGFGGAYDAVNGSIAGFDNVSVSPVPLPAAAWLLLSGLAGIGAIGRRRKLEIWSASDPL